MTDFLLHYAARTPRAQRQWSGSYIQAMSFDPAVVNLGVRAERRHFAPLQIEPLLYDRVNVTGFATAAERAHEIKTTLPDTIMLKYLDYLGTLLPLVMTTHIFVIERQLSKKNPMAIRIFQHILTWLLLHLRESELCPDIYEVDSKWVKRMMSLPSNLKKKAKTIMPYRVQLIMLQYGDNRSRAILFSPGKKDDLGDCYAQLEVVFRHVLRIAFAIDPGTTLHWAEANVGNHVLMAYQQQCGGAVTYAG